MTFEGGVGIGTGCTWSWNCVGVGTQVSTRACILASPHTHEHLQVENLLVTLVNLVLLIANYKLLVYRSALEASKAKKA